MSNLKTYQGKRAVVVGGGGMGIGGSVVKLLGELDAEVHVADIQEPTSPVGSFVKTDLQSTSSIDEAIGKIGGPVHALFNCAGIPHNRGSGLDLMTVNFLGLRHLTERTIPLMPEGSSIVSIASIAGNGWQLRLPLLTDLVTTASFQDGSAWCEKHLEEVGDGYSTSKEALIIYTMLRCVETIKAGVRMNVISPGATETPMLPDFRLVAGDQVVGTVYATFGRPSTPEEQAAVMAFLNSPAASYVNGVNVATDGGFTAAATMGLLPQS
jgi:NAD(P)-dependent dehydrogenase (short-subunit alcohol dehydrogenase family)